MDSENLRTETINAIAEARHNGDVPVVFIGGPSDKVITAVQGEVRKTFPHAQFKTKVYSVEPGKNAGYRNWEASQGSTDVRETYIPRSRETTPSDRGSPSGGSPRGGSPKGGRR